MMDPSESFPCIICGCRLDRVTDSFEGQPDDGVMCQSHGNYGSTVFDPEDLSYLAFNICDNCIVEKAQQGRVMVTRSFMPVLVDHMGMVGSAVADRPYIPWRRGLPDDNEHIELDLFEDLDDLMATGKIQLHVPIEQVREQLRKNREDIDGSS